MVSFQQVFPCRSKVSKGFWAEAAKGTLKLFVQGTTKTESVVSRAPPQKEWGQGKRSKPQPGKDKMDLRNVIITRKASAKRF